VAYLDTVEPGYWQPGHFRPDAYELTFSYERLPKRGDMDPHRLDDLRHFLIDRLRKQMLAAMHAAGWQVVGQTNKGREIWQYHPSIPAISPSQTPRTEVDTNKQESGTGEQR
jgi:hypothetical protein